MTTEVPNEMVEGLDDKISKKVALFQDQKADGTSGGTFTSGAWRDRDMNTEVYNNIPGLSLNVSNGQLTIPAGEYIIKTKAMAYKCGAHQTRIYNLTDTAVSSVGEKLFSSASIAISTNSACVARITLTSSKIFQLQHYCDTTKATDGLGYGASTLDGTVGVFASLEVEKLD